MLLASCGGNGNGKSLAEGASGDMEAYEGGDVNAIEQARPQIMVIPADQTLKSFGALKETNIDGKGFVVRELKKAYPRALIVGHRDLNPQKECPCFDAVKEYKEL